MSIYIQIIHDGTNLNFYSTSNSIWDSNSNSNLDSNSKYNKLLF